MPQKEVEDALRCIALHSVKILFRLSFVLCLRQSTKDIHIKRNFSFGFVSFGVSCVGIRINFFPIALGSCRLANSEIALTLCLIPTLLRGLLFCSLRKLRTGLAHRTAIYRRCNPQSFLLCMRMCLVECKPKKAICILNCDLEVESPNNYIELRKEETNAIANKVSIFNSERIKKLTVMQDNKFKGHCVRLDGKKITKRDVIRMEKQIIHVIHDNEEDYNPRKNKIENKPRIHFHCVGTIK